MPEKRLTTCGSSGDLQKNRGDDELGFRFFRADHRRQFTALRDDGGQFAHTATAVP